MEIEEISDLRAKLVIATERLRSFEERDTAGQLALETMHEIRNPLEALGNLTYLALECADAPAKVRDYLTRAEEQLATLNRVASQALGFARSSSSPRPIDLVGIAGAALRIHQRVIEEKKVHLVKEMPEKLIAEGHAGQMLQVVSNIIANALDALPNRGTLCLRLRKRGDEVEFVIADNGHGIRPEHISNIFQPFFTTKGDRGTGLGLPLSRNIIERHRGTMRLRSSVRPGKSGTIFKISIPAQLE